MTAKAVKAADKKAPVTKAELIRQTMGVYNKPLLFEVENAEPLNGIYVKAFKGKEYRDLVARLDDFEKKYDDGYNQDRELCLMLFNSEGVQLFDPENMEDVLFLANLPQAFRNSLQAAGVLPQTVDGLKNLLKTGKISL